MGFCPTLPAPTWRGLPGEQAAPACFPGTGRAQTASAWPRGRQRDICQCECSHTITAWLPCLWQVTGGGHCHHTAMGKQDRKTLQQSSTFWCSEQGSAALRRREKQKNVLAPEIIFPVSYQLMQKVTRMSEVCANMCVYIYIYKSSHTWLAEAGPAAFERSSFTVGPLCKLPLGNSRSEFLQTFWGQSKEGGHESKYAA